MPDVKQRISIGFHGQTLAARVAPDQLASLRSALESRREGWHELQVEDGSVLLDLAKVVFVQVDAGEQRVGFGA